MSGEAQSTAAEDGAQQRASVILVKERNEAHLDDPYETVHSPSTIHPSAHASQPRPIRFSHSAPPPFRM